MKNLKKKAAQKSEVSEQQNVKRVEAYDAMRKSNILTASDISKLLQTAPEVG
jgi:uncharacterized membrane protein